ncbi:hypothetical protein NPIL_252931 [Nephila pilipes]|uniref:Uncharacterized protein n=1 Tax=Nephila pilipes TaxID=299642 RepID=A0A8X6QQ02_NEPPI|nr:hypothetical protein NPIL_252931 [Nephila pilipes]
MSMDCRGVDLTTSAEYGGGSGFDLSLITAFARLAVKRCGFLGSFEENFCFNERGECSGRFLAIVCGKEESRFEKREINQDFVFSHLGQGKAQLLPKRR